METTSPVSSVILPAAAAAAAAVAVAVPQGRSATSPLPADCWVPYPSLPCKKPFTCDPKPAFPEPDPKDVEAARLPPPVMFTQKCNFQV